MHAKTCAGCSCADRLAALLGAMCIAFSGIFYLNADVSPMTGTVFRSLFGLLALAPWLAPGRSLSSPGAEPPRRPRASLP